MTSEKQTMRMWDLAVEKGARALARWNNEDPDHIGGKLSPEPNWRRWQAQSEIVLRAALGPEKRE